MNQPKQHPIDLKQGAVKYLRDMISATGWGKTTTDIILGGQLLMDVVPENTEPPTRVGHTAPDDFKGETLKWTNTPMKPFSCTQKQYDACRKAIDHFVAQGAIPPTQSAAELLLAFGYSSE